MTDRRCSLVETDYHRGPVDLQPAGRTECRLAASTCPGHGRLACLAPAVWKINGRYACAAHKAAVIQLVGRRPTIERVR